jgi:hypothetical protein
MRVEAQQAMPVEAAGVVAVAVVAELLLAPPGATRLYLALLTSIKAMVQQVPYREEMPRAVPTC